MANQYDAIGKHFEAKAVSRGEFEALNAFQSMKRSMMAP